jgi:hypothetical protein
MKADRPLIGAVLFLAAGLGLIFGNCHGTAGVNAALPLSGSSLEICTTTSGAGALGGFALTVIGVALLLVAFVCAVLGQIGLIGFGPSRAEVAKVSEPPKE